MTVTGTNFTGVIAVTFDTTATGVVHLKQCEQHHRNRSRWKRRRDRRFAPYRTLLNCKSFTFRAAFVCRIGSATTGDRIVATNPPYLPVDTASVSWIDTNGDFHIHVFTTNGYTISERYLTSQSNGWTNGTLSQPGNLVSATAWANTEGGGSIRVYATSDDTTTEWCLDGNESSQWYQGGYTLS